METQSIGLYCDKAGITSVNPFGTFQEVGQSRNTINNGIMLELYIYTTLQKNKFTNFHEAVQAVFNLPDLTAGSLRHSLEQLKTNEKKLRKTGKTRDGGRDYVILNFKKEIYVPPSASKKRRLEFGEPSSASKKVRYEEIISNLKSESKRLKGELCEKGAKLEDLRVIAGAPTLGKLKQKVRSMKYSAANWKKRYEEASRTARRKRMKVVSQAIHNITVDALKTKIEESNQLKKEKAILENEIEELKEELEEQKDLRVFAKNGKEINPRFKAASMFLQNLGLGEHNINSAIKLVVQSITGTTVDGAMPSRSTHSRIGSEMKALALKTVKEGVEGQNNLTLKYDGTTDKYGRHVTEVEVATESNTFLVGLRKQAGSTAADYASTISDTLGDIRPDVLKQVANTMTDRHVVNSAVDKILEEEKGGELNKFRCGMHPLDSFAKVCDVALKEVNTVPLDKYPQMPYISRGESLTQALLRCTEKLFHDNSIGLCEDLQQYLQDCGYSGTYLSWKGNKFDLLFINAAYAYEYKESIVTFLTKIRRSNNKAALSALNMYTGGDCFGELRCLGLIERYITGPWMREIGEDGNILDMNDKYKCALETLKTWIADPSPLLQGSTKHNCFLKTVKEDGFLEKAWGADGEDSHIMTELIKAILKVMERQLIDQLPGGKFWEPSAELVAAASSCTSNNISGERQFGQMKSRQLRAPAANMSKHESKQMFSSNKVGAWLEGLLKKSDVEVREEIRWATKEGRKLREKDKNQEQKYREAVRRKMEASRKAVSVQDQRRTNNMEVPVEGVFKYGGYWRTEEEMETHIRNLNKTKAKEALKAQIKVRTLMLNTKTSVNFKFTTATVQDFKNELVTMMRAECEVESDSDVVKVMKDPQILIGRKTKQKFESESGADRWWDGEIKSSTVNQHGDLEFEFHFSNEDTAYHETIAEIIVDLARGDMTLQ